jgi:hypothetical protein
VFATIFSAILKGYQRAEMGQIEPRIRLLERFFKLRSHYHTNPSVTLRVSGYGKK